MTKTDIMAITGISLIILPERTKRTETTADKSVRFKKFGNHIGDIIQPMFLKEIRGKM